MIVHEGIARLVERLYAAEPDDVRWMEGIHEAALGAFEGLGHVQVLTLRLNEAGRPIPGHLVGHDVEETWLMHESADAADLRRLYFSGPVQTGRAVIEQSENAKLVTQYGRAMNQAKAADAYGMIGHDTDGGIVTLALGTTGGRLQARTRQTLARVAAHLGTAFRLRRRASPARATLHQDRGRWRDDSRQDGWTKLEAAAAAIDRAKRHVAGDPEAALGYWKAMVDGRWTIVERFESDGRRILAAHANEPTTQELRALTDDERKVIAMAALGHPARLVAYELGFAESTTSEMLSAALRKLGLADRSELARVYGALCKPEVP